MLLKYLKRCFSSLYLGCLLYSMVGHYISQIPKHWIVITLTLTNTLLALMSFILLLFLTVAVIMGAKGVNFLIKVRKMIMSLVGMGDPAIDDSEVNNGDSFEKKTPPTTRTYKKCVSLDEVGDSESDDLDPLAHIHDADTEPEEMYQWNQAHCASQ